MERYGHRESFLLSGVKFSNNKPSHPLFLSILTSAMKMLHQVHPIHPPDMLRDLPAFSKSLHIIQAVTDVISLGLATTVFPHAMAGAIFQVNK